MVRPFRLVNAMPQPIPPRRPRAAAAALAALLLLPGCSFFQAPVIQRGNRVTEDQLKEITPGVQTKQDVQTLLGSPTQTSTFGDDTWYYISANTRQRPGRSLALTDQQTVVVNFDGRGVVNTVRTLTEADGTDVTPIARETPTPGNERTLLQALFGNIGRIGPGSTTQGQGATGGIGPGTQATPGPQPMR